MVGSSSHVKFLGNIIVFGNIIFIYISQNVAGQRNTFQRRVDVTGYGSMMPRFDDKENKLFPLIVRPPLTLLDDVHSTTKINPCSKVSCLENPDQ